MRRVLFIGDVHATPQDLDDCQLLLRLVGETIAEEALAGAPVDEVCFLGDSYHSHNVIRAEVLSFWRQGFKELRQLGVPIRVLVGNHDFSGEGSAIHALIAHEDQVDVVDRPVIDRGVLYLPYYSDREAFVEACRSYARSSGVLPPTTLVCHQTFAGSKYENGFYAEDGVNPDLVPQQHIISGHIHTPQSFGRVTYVGAPRWRTLSDANVERALWLYEFSDDGGVLSKKSFDTGTACRQIRYVLDTQEDPFTGDLDPRHDWRVDVRGDAAYVEKRRAELARPGVRLRTFKTSNTAPKVRESEGVGVAFRKYLGAYKPRGGTSIDVLSSMASERLGF